MIYLVWQSDGKISDGIKYGGKTPRDAALRYAEGKIKDDMANGDSMDISVYVTPENEVGESGTSFIAHRFDMTITRNNDD